ncbi:hypothetical protein BCR41DRAFT_358919 [Lobosporangium transversale]|uniref:Uncharacterized protein n=1 Tax=Lobosporangium transversale TaxID=64571 RepID=A0A1Y2GHE8_9FUNG|nr:hypothetical protein BCR41DRAFT_358919 [Lobosporangium transversale]ORZ09132.1 hypothetical protein BCR41DRAFT_358919 [Lobosporangium transversale]|eukprot:XP_021878759.1 hypothetical protein BCR41DRAFT_358919 [Lobosporangium transversale]
MSSCHDASVSGVHVHVQAFFLFLSPHITIVFLLLRENKAMCCLICSLFSVIKEAGQIKKKFFFVYLTRILLHVVHVHVA